MIFAVAILHEPFGRDLVIAEGGGAVEADAFGWDGVDFTGGMPQVVFESGPIGVVEAREDNAQAVVGELTGPERLSEECLQGMGVLSGPVLDRGFAVVGFGEEKGEPSGGQRPVVESLVEVVGPKVAAEDLREAQTLDDAEEKGNVVNAFVLQSKRWGNHAGHDTHRSASDNGIIHEDDGE
jgi:hypothetical protein